jgi:hypothetical protein
MRQWRRMLTDNELRDLRAEAMRYPECIECRTILRLLDEIERLSRGTGSLGQTRHVCRAVHPGSGVAQE